MANQQPFATNYLIKWLYRGYVIRTKQIAQGQFNRIRPKPF